MNKSVLLVLVAAAALTIGLYTRPKVVVSNKENALTAAPANSGHVNQAETGTTEGGDTHENPLTTAQQQKLAGLQQAFRAATGTNRVKAAYTLSEAYRAAQKFDSAAHYAIEAAKLQPDVEAYLKAGDLSYEAYTFAMNADKAAQLGEQTRDWYGKALAKNPNLLTAKANMAMTYVSTPTPMQGISLLREIIQQDPNNEAALFNLGMLAIQSGQYDRAAERFRQILTNNPTHRKALFYLGISLAEAGHKEEAKEVLGKVKAQEKDPQVLKALQEYETRLQ